MKTIVFKISCLFLFLTCALIKANAQFDAVYIGVNGLTCSQCTRSVEMQIRKLNYVADVEMNLEHTEGKITLKRNMKPDIEKIAQAVYNAGFSVRYLKADLTINNAVTQTGSCIRYEGDEYVFADAPKEPLSGTVKLKFIGKKYLPKNEYKKLQAQMDKKCGDVDGKVYHVAM